MQEGGVAALKHRLAAEAEQAKPEFLKQRPKYYYYYRWMKERITEHCAQLPASVMDKLLTIDAGELDLLLQHESAIKAKVSWASQYDLPCFEILCHATLTIHQGDQQCSHILEWQ